MIRFNSRLKIRQDKLSLSHIAQKTNKCVKFITLSNLLLLAACGKPDVPHDIDPYFTPFIAYFKQEADKNNVGYGDIDNITVMRFEKPGEISSSTEAALCHIYNNYQEFIFKYNREVHREIIFSSNFKYEELAEQYDIFLHEMGHCAYHLEHTPNPEDIMYFSPSQKDFLSLQLNEKKYFIEAQNNRANWNSSDPL